MMMKETESTTAVAPSRVPGDATCGLLHPTRAIINIIIVIIIIILMICMIIVIIMCDGDDQNDTSAVTIALDDDVDVGGAAEYNVDDADHGRNDNDGAVDGGDDDGNDRSEVNEECKQLLADAETQWLHLDGQAVTYYP